MLAKQVLLMYFPLSFLSQDSIAQTPLLPILRSVGCSQYPPACVATYTPTPQGRTTHSFMGQTIQTPTLTSYHHGCSLTLLIEAPRTLSCLWQHGGPRVSRIRLSPEIWCPLPSLLLKPLSIFTPPATPSLWPLSIPFAFVDRSHPVPGIQNQFQQY